MHVNNEDRACFKYAWFCPGLDFIRFLLWRVFRGIIPVNELRMARHMSQNTIFSLCKVVTETLTHDIHDCNRRFGLLFTGLLWVFDNFGCF